MNDAIANGPPHAAKGAPVSGCVAGHQDEVGTLSERVTVRPYRRR
jgi:hypothetical protein